MLIKPVHTGKIWVLPSTIICIRMTGDAVTVVTATEIARIETDHPRFLYRDLVSARISEIQPELQVGSGPLGYYIDSVTISMRRPKFVGGSPVVPDYLRVPRDTLLLEAPCVADYHPYESLEVIGIRNKSRLIIALAESTFEIVFPLGDASAQHCRKIVDNHLLKERRIHLTAQPRNHFLDEAFPQRIYCEDLAEVPRPKSWGGDVEILHDFRGDPRHAEFRKRMTAQRELPGLDIN